MLKERRGFQMKLHTVTIEEWVPEDHFLRKLEAAVDFSFIYDEVREWYSTGNGRPGMDPVMLVKYLLIGFLYGILSERRLFERVLAICIEKGLADGKLILTDSTHVRANASRQSEVKVMVEKEAAWYMERLDKYEEQERRELEGTGKIPAKRIRYKKKAEPKQTEKTVSATDTEAGMLHRPGKPAGMHYLDHQSVDAEHGIIVDVAVTPGNVTDAAPYLDRMEYLREKIWLPIEAVGVDSGYDVSLVHQEWSEKKVEIYTPRNEEEHTYKAEFHRQDFENLYSRGEMADWRVIFDAARDKKAV